MKNPTRVRPGRTPSRRLRIEPLEDRAVPSIVPGIESSQVHPHYTVLRPGAPADGGVVQMGETATPAGSQTPYASSKTPAQIRKAYGLDNISFGGVTGDGSGQTVAIVDAYDDPNILNDLKTFSTQFGLPAPTATSFKKVNQTGGTTYPAANSGWAGEICLDVEWVHAIAPKANILLVEANDSFNSNLQTAVNYAKSVAGVSVISMSYGGGEFSSEGSYDSVYASQSGHPVTFIASSGDTGGIVEQPSVSPNVLAVGGTSLFLTGSNAWSSESAWSGSGGGVSQYEAQPGYQSGAGTPSSTKRTVPDVAFDADPNTGVAVCDSYNDDGSGPWDQFGGTSFSAPAWAAMLSIANQGRALNGLAALDGRGDTLPKLYALPAADFHDITSGSAGNFSAGAGYDLTTGRGSPLGATVIGALAGGSAQSTGPVTFVNAKTATYTEADGDKVTVAFGKPVLSAGNVNAVLKAAAAGAGAQLQTIDLTGVGSAAAGTSITVSVKRAAHSDGQAAVGLIDATGIDLGAVTVAGDLGKILAGDGVTKTAGLASLSVGSLGRLGTNSQSSGDLSSAVVGAIKTLTVKTDVAAGASLLVYPGSYTYSADAGITKFTVNGNLNGVVNVYGNLGTVTVHGDYAGGAYAAGNLGTAHVYGSVSGSDNNGTLVIRGNAGAVTVGGGVYGGAARFSGVLEVDGTVGTMSVGRDVIGGAATEDYQDLEYAGLLAAGKHAGKITIGGSLISGAANGFIGDVLTFAGAVLAYTDIGSLTITGNVLGRDVPAVISAQRQTTVAGQTSKTDTAIGTLTIKGSVINASVLAGYDWGGNATNGSAQIGTVTVAGDWVRSNLLAGVNADGSAISTRSNASALSKIGAFNVGGQILGSSSAGETFLISAENILGMKVGGGSVSLTAGAHNDDFTLGFYGNMYVTEV